MSFHATEGITAGKKRELVTRETVALVSGNRKKKRSNAQPKLPKEKESRTYHGSHSRMKRGSKKEGGGGGTYLAPRPQVARRRE